MSWLFMGQVPDPDLDTAEARGFPRIYDASAPMTEADLRAIRSAPRRPPGGRPGRAVLTGGGECRCGRCLWETRCPLDTAGR